jgi:hypothetical protein
MAVDISDVLNRAWRIARNHKVLWTFGFLISMTGFLIFPFMFVPIIGLMQAERTPAWLENPLYIAGWVALFGLYLLVVYLVNSVARPAIVLGALRANQDEPGLGFIGLLQASLPFFWRFLGLSLLFALASAVISFLITAVQMVGMVLTMGLASLCLTPLSFLVYPLLYVGLAWLELAEAAIVVDGLGVMDAARRGWQVIRENKLSVLLLTLILYLGVGLLTGVFILPLMAPFFALPFALEDGETAGRILRMTGLCTLIYLPFFAVLQGAVLAFMKSGWLVGYLQLRRKSDALTVAAPAA